MFGLVRVGVVSPKLAVADCEFNKNEIIKVIDDAWAQDVQILVFPELAVTGASCGDLFYQRTLLENAKKALAEIVAATEDKKMLAAVGLPVVLDNKIFNVAAVLGSGRIWGVVPKAVSDGKRQFAAYDKAENVSLWTGDEWVGFGIKTLFTAETMPNLKIAVAIGDDAFNPQMTYGADLVLNLRADGATVVSAAQSRKTAEVYSHMHTAAYACAAAGMFESTQDMVFGGNSFICENGKTLAVAKPFAKESVLTVADVDIDLLSAEQQKTKGMNQAAEITADNECFFEMADLNSDEILRPVAAAPFAPVSDEAMVERCANIFGIQTAALARRLLHTRSQTAVVGISGGLDSTLALLVIAGAFDFLGWDRKNIIGITMPGFGTTDRTYNNALALMEALGITMKEISIVPAIKGHLADIGHDIADRNVTYENAQARERTQILMDIANDNNGLVIGTGDLSELALGWATYNGDHMAMYGVNAGIPKTLVRLVVDWISRDGNFGEKASAILQDVLDTPISPELLPPTEDGEIKQKTEDIVGPYELHDFFLYYVVRCGFEPAKIYAYAKKAWGSVYDDATLLKWLKNFYRRFFTQQFKRSCMPDGPMVGAVTLSPRGGWQMPTDASVNLWLQAVEELN